MERIVIGVDSEVASESAIDWVIRRARHTPLSVSLITAVDSPIDDPTYARDRQHEMADRIRSIHPGIRVDLELAQGSIHRALMERSGDADLLVIGSHRSRPIRSLLAGEISALIASQATCPTVIVPDDWTPSDGEIVVGLGVDHTSDPALLFAVREADHRSSILRLVHASMEGGSSPRRAILHAAGLRLRASHPNALIVEDLVQGRPTDALLAEGGAAEMIVVGAHHFEPRFGLLLGSASSFLVRRCCIPVCIVPDSGERLAAPQKGRAAERALDPIGVGRP